MNEVVLLARKLDAGGAERQLVTLARGLAERDCVVHVMLFYRGGVLDHELTGTRVQVHYLDKSGRWDTLAFLVRLVRLLRRLRPAVIYSFLDLPNILAVLAAPWVGSPRIVWSIRAAGVEVSRYGWLARLTAAVESRLSRRANKVIANSHAGAAWAAQRGFPADRIVVIENGIDTERYRPDANAREAIRQKWGIPPQRRVIALVARLDVMKDYPNFLRAADLVLARGHDVHFLCVGGGAPPFLAELQALARQLGLDARLTWTGVWHDMPALYNAIDLVCLASAFGEGFPNVVGEAMACGVPCVVTHVGDAGRIVGDCGETVPPRNAPALARGLEQLLARLASEYDLGLKARARIESLFSVPRMLERTSEVLGVGREGGAVAGVASRPGPG